jgi:hypothetical protein
MHAARTLTAMFGAVLVAAALSAQTPASEIDAHIGAAKAAAALEYRATFVNLCLPSAQPIPLEQAATRPGA